MFGWLRSLFRSLWNSRTTSGPGAQASAWNGQFEDTVESQWSQSVALDQLLQGDYACVVAAQDKEYPNAKNMRPRFLPLVQRWTDEVATAYDRTPHRVFGQLDPAQADKLADVYRRSGLNAAMRDALRKLVSQNTVLLLPFPRELRTVALQSCCPYEFDVTVGNPLFGSDVASLSEVCVRVPVDQAPDGGLLFGKLVLRRDLAYVERDDKTRFSPYNLDPENLTNPWGQLPMVVMRTAAPPKGKFCAPVDQALLGETIAICLGHAGTDQTIKYSGFPQRIIEHGENANVTKEDLAGLPIGPEHWVALPNGAKLTAMHTQAQVAEFDRHLEMNLKTFAVLRGLPPDWFLKQYTNIQAKAFDRHDNRLRRLRYQEPLEQAERELAMWVARMTNLRDAVQLPDNLTVDLRWAEWEVDADPQSAAQARAMAYKAGEDSPVKYIARRDNLTEAEAQAVLQANLAQVKVLGGTAEPATGAAA